MTQQTEAIITLAIQLTEECQLSEIGTWYFVSGSILGNGYRVEGDTPLKETTAYATPYLDLTFEKNIGALLPYLPDNYILSREKDKWRVSWCVWVGGSSIRAEFTDKHVCVALAKLALTYTRLSRFSILF